MKKILMSLGLLLATTPIQVTKAASFDHVTGRILLQVESHGEAWYVDPLTNTKHYLGRPEDALHIMRQLGLGITNKNLESIPTTTQTKQGDLALRRQVAGRILLQVESHGEAWYVDPLSLKRIYLGRPIDALNVMRSYGLGITNNDLAQIPTSSQSGEKSIRQEVPFTAQAPFGNWNDPRQQDGCEESSAIMAVAWARSEGLTNEQAEEYITSMSDWEDEMFGYFMDSSIDDTANNLLKTYLNFDNFTVQKNITTQNIKNELNNGNIVIVAVNGIKLENPYFVGGGPLRHMALIVGYDASTNAFLTHDPGTQYGAYYPYTEETIANALMDYPSGNHVPVTPMPTGMIVIEKE